MESDARHPMANLRTGVLLTAIVGIGALSIDMFLPSLPAIAREFGSDEPTAQLGVTLFLLCFAVAQLVFGPVSDRYGRRPALLGGLALYLAGAVLCACATSMRLLVLARALQGFGAGSGPVLGRAIVRDVFARDQAARVMALMATAMALTPILAPILGGYLQVWCGWRAVFATLTACGLGFLCASALFLPESLALPDPGALAGRTVAANMAELRRHPEYALLVLVVTASFSGQFAFISGSAFVLIGLLGVTPDVYGWSFGLVAVGLMVGSYASARTTVRVGPLRLIRLGSLLLCGSGAAMAALALAGHESVAGILAPMFLYAVAGGLLVPNAMACAVGPFPRTAGLASALLGFSQTAGAAAYCMVASRFYDGTTRPMTCAVALSGLACLLAARRLREPAAGLTS